MVSKATDHQGAKKDPIQVVPLGCSLHELWAPKDGDNICLRFRDPEHQITTGNPAYFGETIGRVANRISDCRLKDLNGRDYDLPCNGDGRVTLHGGERGWGKQDWNGPHLVSRKDGDGVMRENVQRFTYFSPHGDQGFPGNVEARAWWFSWNEVDDSSGRSGGPSGEPRTVVEVEYEAEMVGEQPEGVTETVVAMTNHAYFNLSPTCQSDAPSISGTILTLSTTSHLVTNPTNGLPTGEIAVSSPPGHGISPNEEFLLGSTVPELDDCFVHTLSPASLIPPDTRNSPLKECVKMFHPKTDITLEVHTTEPAFQVYTGDGVDVEAGGVHFGRRSGIAVEPGRYTDACNVEGWRGMVRIGEGEVWGSRSRYVVSKGGRTEGP